jgi:hypothetical protein
VLVRLKLKATLWNIFFMKTLLGSSQDLHALIQEEQHQQSKKRIIENACLCFSPSSFKDDGH